MEPLRLAVQQEPRGKRKPNAGRPTFSVPDALRRADETLAGPCRGFDQRVPGRGRLLHRFVLPLDLCKTANALISMVGGRGRPTSKRDGQKNQFGGAAKAAAYKEQVFRMMWLQHSLVRAEPLPLNPRPLLRAIRFSVKETDTGSNGLKTAIDMLRVPSPPIYNPKTGKFDRARKGLGFLVDDAPRYCETAMWWEYAPPGKGFGLLEVWSG